MNTSNNKHGRCCAVERSHVYDWHCTCIALVWGALAGLLSEFSANTIGHLLPLFANQIIRLTTIIGVLHCSGIRSVQQFALGGVCFYIGASVQYDMSWLQSVVIWVSGCLVHSIISWWQEKLSLMR